MKKKINIILALLLTSLTYGQWDQQFSNTGNSLYDIEHFDENLIIAVGDNVITRTVDGGITWNAQYAGQKLNAISIVDYNTIYICGNGGFLLKSTDGGVTWQQKNTGYLVTYTGIDFINKDVGCVVGNAGIIMRTIDGGETWSQVDSGASLVLTDIDFVTDTLGFVVGGAGRIIRTMDAGQTWAEVYTETNRKLNGVHFMNAEVGFAVGAGTVVRTINGGDTFSTLYPGTYSDLTDIKAFSPQTIYVAGPLPSLRKSPDSGNNWYEQISTDRHIYAVSIVNDSTIFISGSGGFIAKTTNGGGPLGIDDFNKQNPLITIFPNPIDDIVTIDIHNKLTTDISIKIYDLQGKIIFQSATYIKTIDLSNLIKGEYILVVNVDNEIISKKIIKK